MKLGSKNPFQFGRGFCCDLEIRSDAECLSHNINRLIHRFDELS